MISVNIPTLAVFGIDDAAVAEGARRAGVALKTSELRAIAERLGRDPTQVEAHAFDAQWSEHCSYKSSRAFLSRLPTEGPAVLLGPKEDAGIVRLGDWNGRTYGIVIAHESHNHPSQVVPFEGAATGIGGIVRDVLCMGARVIAVADPLRFGPLDDAHCRYVAQGVVDGIAAYGNAIGVPNIAGDVYFHDGFRDNCLVNVVALGLVAENEVIHSAAPPESEGWDIVLVGKATDRSGFGGAAFSSLVLDDEDAEANKGAVQVPDPFLKSVIMRATYRVFNVIAAEKIHVGFKDLGAGGIMGCTAELVASGGFGATIDLDRCPTSQPDLPAAVIAVGETQERLAWVVPPHFTSRLLGIYNDEFGLPDIAQGAQAAIIGRVERSADYVLRHHHDEVMRVPIDFLTTGIRYERARELPLRKATLGEAAAVAPAGAAFTWDGSAHFRQVFLAALAHRDVCSRAPIFERYDSVVRGTTSLPCGTADAGVIVPVPGAPLGVALAVDGNPRYATVDVRFAAEHAVYEAVRNVVTVGAVPAALTDCLNFGNPEDPIQFGQFVAAVDGIACAARALSVPFVSGNVSLYNQSASGHAIPGSPIIACVGTFADVSRSLTPSLKVAGSRLYRLGRVSRALGGSVFAQLRNLDADALAAIDYDAVRREHAALLEANDRGLIRAAHDVSDGGTLVALAEMAFPTLARAPLGVQLDRDPDAFEAFGEFGGIVLEVGDEPAFEAVCERHGVFPGPAAADSHGQYQAIGRTTAVATLASPAGTIAAWSEAYDAWSTPLQDFYAGSAS